MSKNKEESIYQFISHMSKENPDLPYSFQNIDIAGKMDVCYTLCEDGLPGIIQERLSMEIMDKVADCIKKSDAIGELHIMLNKTPVFLCMTKLFLKVKI